MAQPSSDRAVTIAHYVSLKGFGGVEQQFAAFLPVAARRTGIRQTVVAASTRIHAHHREALAAASGGTHAEKKIFGVTLGHRPAGLRRMRYRWLARRLAPDVALLWNRLGQQSRVLDALGERRCLYWEHGSAWLAGETRAKAHALARMPAVICNSHAARRLLQLQWDYAGATRVCRNGIRAPADPDAVKTLQSDRPMRLGVACRLVPIKAVNLAIHAMAELGRRGFDATLDIAGDGPERAALQALCRQLGVAGRVRFLGVVKDMRGFFGDIDALVHPALREPFGMVAGEAGAAGCPVICAAVDGLPEVVADGQTGVCVPLDGDLDRYRALGGRTDGLPPVVYVPAEDCVAAPRISEPEVIADAVVRLAEDPAGYRAMSAAAIARIGEHFDFERHVDDVLAAAREYAATGTLVVDRP